MSDNVALVLAEFAFLGLAVVAVALWTNASRFFSELVSLKPELQGLLVRPGVFTRYGPLIPSQMAYLQSKGFRTLPDQHLRALGRRCLTLLYSYAVLFLLMLLSLLFWSVTKGS